MNHAKQIAEIARVTEEYKRTASHIAPRIYDTYWSNTDTPQEIEITREELHITGYAPPDHTDDLIAAIDRYTAAHLWRDPVIICYSRTTYKRLKAHAKDRRLLLLLADIDRRKEIAQLENAENMIAINPNDHHGRRAYNRKQSELHAIRTAVYMTRKDPSPAEPPRPEPPTGHDHHGLGRKRKPAK